MRRWTTIGLLLGAAVLLGGGPAAAEPPVQHPTLTLERAVTWALQNNPDLAVVRKQRGIAAAGVVIARTYPFNPVWQSYYFDNSGPASAGITSWFATNQQVRLDLELRGQGKIRQHAAQAALSRTDWEIATQELLIAIRTIRAFETLLYRQEKTRLLEECVRIQEEAYGKIEQLVRQGQLRPADLLTARGDLVEARAAVGPGRALVVAAANDLRRLLGIEGAVPPAEGEMEAQAPEADITNLEEVARARRPDLHALHLLVAEADQRVKLEIANRYGNPSVGPAVNYNETRTVFAGTWLIYALPVLNTRRGDIMQRQAERDRAIADEHRLAVQVGQDVQAARDRLAEARKWVHYFADESLPALRGAVKTLEDLFAGGEPGVDVLRVIDARRRLLRARDSYLDALWELSQARADLAAAVGDFTLLRCTPPELASPRPLLLPPVGHPE